jgi:TPR repeat protein
MHIARPSLAILLAVCVTGCGDSPEKVKHEVKSEVAPTVSAEVRQFEGYKDLANKGDPVAQFKLGIAYFNGEGVAKDLVEALKWHRKAADQQLVEAEYIVAVCYDEGKGVEIDRAEALKWYRKAAEHGVAEAQYRMGVHHGAILNDWVEAVKWYRKAADQGVDDAQFWMGCCYLNGQGVAKDEVEAYAYLNLAAITHASARSMRDNLKNSLLPPDVLALGVRRTTELHKEIEAKIEAKQAAKRAGK